MEEIKVQKTPDVLILTLYVDNFPVGTSEISTLGNMNYYSRLFVNPKFRGKGYGRKLWDKTQEVLDEYDMDLTIDINPYGPLNHEDLVHLYSSERTKEVFGTIYRIKKSVFEGNLPQENQ